jgi:hypothetical protein
VLPNSIPLRNLKATSPAFDAAAISLNSAFYSGGDAFRRVADKVLHQRELEKRNPESFKNRCNKTAYVPHSAIIDYLCAAVFLDEPRIECPEDSTGYWEGLNKNADGTGQDLATIARQLLLEVFVNERAYIALDFDSEVGAFDSGSTLDARWRFLPAGAVDDWGTGFYRIHLSLPVREEIWQPSTKTLEKWIYVTSTEVGTYEYIEEPGKALDLKTEIPGKVIAHNFGVIPVFPVRLSHGGMHVMGRIRPILEALFNRESAHAYSLDQGAFAIPVLNLISTPITEVIAAESVAMKLTSGESLTYVSPDAAIYGASVADIDRLRTELARAVHGLALEAQAKTQAPRQGAFAAQIQRGPMDALLASYAAPIRDVLENVVEAVRVYRSDSFTPKLAGFNTFSADLSTLTAAVGQGDVASVPATPKGTPMMENEDDGE